MDRSSSQVEQELRRRILVSAAELFLAKGYKGVSMKMLAQAVEVTSGALYYHFPGGKEEIFTAMVRTLFVEEAVGGIDQALAGTHGVRERLVVLTSALLALPLDERLSVLLRDAREHVTDPEHRQVILSLLEAVRGRVVGVFQEAHDAGEIRPDLPVRALVSLYMGMLREGKGLEPADRAASLVSVLFDGIAPRGNTSFPEAREAAADAPPFVDEAPERVGPVPGKG